MFININTRFVQAAVLSGAVRQNESTSEPISIQNSDKKRSWWWKSLQWVTTSTNHLSLNITSRPCSASCWDFLLWFHPCTAVVVQNQSLDGLSLLLRAVVMGWLFHRLLFRLLHREGCEGVNEIRTLHTLYSRHLSEMSKKLREINSTANRILGTLSNKDKSLLTEIFSIYIWTIQAYTMQCKFILYSAKVCTPCFMSKKENIHASCL